MECNNNSLSSLIDKNFLANALGKNVDILSIEVTDGSKPGDNYTSLIYSIDFELQKKNEASPPFTRHLLIKCYPVHPSRQTFNNETNLFHRELEIYRLWLPELIKFQTEVLGLKKPYSLPYTPLVAGKSIDFSKLDANDLSGICVGPLDNFIMMEDLRRTWGFQMTNRRESLDIHHMRLVIPALARLHALSWVYKNKVTNDIESKFEIFSQHFKHEDMEFWIKLALSNMDKEIMIVENSFGAESELSKGLRKFKGYIKTLMGVFAGDYLEPTCHEAMRVKTQSPGEFPEPWIVMTHGDCWSNNMLFKYEAESGLPIDVILVDLQMVQEACLTNDLAYVLYASTRAEMRKTHLSDLLKLYFETFNEICATCESPSLPGFTLETLKARFQRAKVVGLMFACAVYPAILKEETQAVDLEKLDADTQMDELFQSALGGDGIVNSVFIERILEVAEEMHEEGII